MAVAFQVDFLARSPRRASIAGLAGMSCKMVQGPDIKLSQEPYLHLVKNARGFAPLLDSAIHHEESHKGS